MVLRNDWTNVRSCQRTEKTPFFQSQRKKIVTKIIIILLIIIMGTKKNKQLSGARKRKKKKKEKEEAIKEAIKEAVEELERLKLGPTALWTGLVLHRKDIFASHVFRSKFLWTGE